MPRRIFPAGTVTNATGNPLRLTFHRSATTLTRETDLWTIDGSNNIVDPIPNGVVIADATGAYSAFAGPDDMDTLYVTWAAVFPTRYTLTATGYVATSNVSGTYAQPGGALRRWRKKLAGDPANAKMVILGDSMSDETTSAQYLIKRLRSLHTQQGRPLYGMTGDSSHIINGGTNGLSLTNWLANPAGAYTLNQNQLAASPPDLLVVCWLNNDIRVGALGTTVSACYTAGRALLVQFLDWCKTNLPNTDVLLRMPNAYLTTNVSSFNYITDGTTTNPAGQAQIYSTAIREIYLSVQGAYPFVQVADVQGDLFGTQSTATHPLMADQLHPTAFGSNYGTTPQGGGYVALADYLAGVIGNDTGDFVTRTGYSHLSANFKPYRRRFLILSGGSGFVDLAFFSGDPESFGPAAQEPISTSDSLWVAGMPGPISLSGGTITRPFNTNNVRILGLTGNDFTSFGGYTATITGDHPGSTTGDRQIVSVDLPSIAAGATGTTTAAVTGARTGALHDATAVLCTPPASFYTAGLVLLGCAPSANDTVTIAVLNPTGGAVDLAAANFAFWVVR